MRCKRPSVIYLPWLFSELFASAENAQILAGYIDELLNGHTAPGERNVGFALLFFPRDEDGRNLAHYDPKTREFKFNGDEEAKP